MNAAPNISVSSPLPWEDLLDRFAGRRVLVVGDVMLDEYLWGDVRRICPEAPVPIVQTKRRTFRPGGAANSAANVAALGARVELWGVVGNDEAGENLRGTLDDAQVDFDGLLAASDRPTTAKIRVIAHQQQVLRIDTEQTLALPPTLTDQLFEGVAQRIPQADALLLCDYAKGVFCSDLAARLIHTARSHNLPVIVDPKGRDYRRYRGATVIKPNLHELEHWDRTTIETREELHSAGKHLMAELNGTAVLVTQGADGMTLFQPGQAPWHQPATAPRAVYDVTGAGDTVVSILALAMACRAPLTQAIQLANLAASIVVGKLGTAVVSPDELRTALHSEGLPTVPADVGEESLELV